jgi:hypothetical protein
VKQISSKFQETLVAPSKPLKNRSSKVKALKACPPPGTFKTADEGNQPTKRPPLEALPAPVSSPRVSRCEPFLELIELSLSERRNAKATWKTL